MRDSPCVAHAMTVPARNLPINPRVLNPAFAEGFVHWHMVICMGMNYCVSAHGQSQALLGFHAAGNEATKGIAVCSPGGEECP